MRGFVSAVDSFRGVERQVWFRKAILKSPAHEGLRRASLPTFCMKTTER